MSDETPMSEEKPPSGDEPPDAARARFAALLVIVALVAGGWWLTRKLGQTGALQDCVATGHRDCGSAETSPR